MIAGDSKNETYPAGNPPSAESRRIKLQIQSFPFLVWPPHLLAQTRNLKRDHEDWLSPIPSARDLVFFYFCSCSCSCSWYCSLATCPFFFFGIRCSTCVQGVPRDFPPRWPWNPSWLFIYRQCLSPYWSLSVCFERNLGWHGSLAAVAGFFDFCFFFFFFLLCRFYVFTIA